jgi:hypothetical protein
LPVVLLDLDVESAGAMNLGGRREELFDLAARLIVDGDLMGSGLDGLDMREVVDAQLGLRPPRLSRCTTD